MTVGELLDRLRGCPEGAPVDVVAGFRPDADGNYELEELGELEAALWVEADPTGDPDHVVLVVGASQEFLDYVRAAEVAEPGLS